MLSFWAGGISSFLPCAREYRLLRRLEISIIISKIIVIITIASCRKEVTKTGGSAIIKDVVIIRGEVRGNEN